MKHLIFIFSIIFTTANAQTITSIDSLKVVIDNLKDIDTISVHYVPNISVKPELVKAFIKGDTLLKTVANYPNSSRLRITYYEQLFKGYAKPLYVKDIDTLTNIVLLEVYASDNEILKSFILKPLDEKEVEFPSKILDNSNFSIEIGFAVVRREAKEYSFVGKLVKAVPLTPGCGTIAWAIVQKFEVLSTTFPNYGNKYVLIIQTCPRRGLKPFFEKGKTYEISVATNSGVTFGYSIVNSYEKENLPTFWTREIKKVN